ncbi:MgtC/SapB family protein [Massilia sp. CF038]|uniref:MgtC/SapB family protein n=1 Tax=Massilia sp. CF038 TaxID=1881045 RepID=UPI00091F4746|nr:MgtC/SapB family protein [Massilia sp. CF038]SHH05439.1 Uncharacterized membrane protein, DUF4010 family [Massilia sp. CF038]
MAFELESTRALAVALGCGLLIGIDRERRKGTGPGRGYAGLRSFALTALGGALAQLSAGALVAAGALLVVALSVVACWRDRSDDPGITTELALFVTYLLGVTAVSHPEVAAGSAVVVAAMLHLRSHMHHFVRDCLKDHELRDGLVLGAAALVLLPLLPDGRTAWLLGINPHRLLGLAILIMTIQAAAHVALRIAGARLGMALSGLASGVVSSVATTAAMGARAKGDPRLFGACVSGALMSNVATFFLLLLVTLTVAPGQIGVLAPLIGAGGVGTMLVAAISMTLQGKAGSSVDASGHAFSLRQACGFAVILSAASVGMAYANAWLGSQAAWAGAVLAGLLDFHAAAASVLSLAAAGTVGARDAELALLLALSANTLSKLVAAFAAGSFAYGIRTGLGLLAILLAAWLPLLLGVGH